MRNFLLLGLLVTLVFSVTAIAEVKCLKIRNRVVDGQVRSTPRLVDADGGGNCPARTAKVATEEPVVPESIIVGYVKSETPATPAIRSFGGSRVTSASIEKSATGFYVVTLVGSFDATDTFDTLGVQCTTNAGGDCNAFISNDTTTAAAPNSIEVGVFTYSAAGGAATDAEFVISVFKGRSS